MTTWLLVMMISAPDVPPILAWKSFPSGEICQDEGIRVTAEIIRLPGRGELNFTCVPLHGEDEAAVARRHAQTLAPRERLFPEEPQL